MKTQFGTLGHLVAKFAVALSLMMAASAQEQDKGVITLVLDPLVLMNNTINSTATATAAKSAFYEEGNLTTYFTVVRPQMAGISCSGTARVPQARPLPHGHLGRRFATSFPGSANDRFNHDNGQAKSTCVTMLDLGNLSSLRVIFRAPAGKLLEIQPPPVEDPSSESSSIIGFMVEGRVPCPTSNMSYYHFPGVVNVTAPSPSRLRSYLVDGTWIELGRRNGTDYCVVVAKLELTNFGIYPTGTSTSGSEDSSEDSYYDPIVVESITVQASFDLQGALNYTYGTDWYMWASTKVDIVPREDIGGIRVPKVSNGTTEVHSSTTTVVNPTSSKADAAIGNVTTAGVTADTAIGNITAAGATAGDEVPSDNSRTGSLGASAAPIIGVVLAIVLVALGVGYCFVWRRTNNDMSQADPAEQGMA